MILSEKMEDSREQTLLDKIRLAINQFIFEFGYGPNITEISSRLENVSHEEITQGLKDLQENHALVLHPNSTEIWVAHPFALFPTLFWVKSKGKQYWSNCPWCSFGIAALLNDDVDIHTKLGGEIDSIIIQIRNHQIVNDQYVVHFPIPASQFWENVVYTCSMMLIFNNEEEVNDWCSRHRKPKGEVLPINQVWELAKIWYGNYLDSNFRRKNKEIAEDMFHQVGLTSSFWKL